MLQRQLHPGRKCKLFIVLVLKRLEKGGQEEEDRIWREEKGRQGMERAVESFRFGDGKGAGWRKLREKGALVEK